MNTASASAKNVANSVGGKTARACDSCITKRARWYCAADDAFLCEACDSSIHSANQLARKHERVRLKITSCNSSNTKETINYDAPMWHKGFTKKARTPRQKAKNPFHLVPEVDHLDDANSNEESDEKLLYRVPILDPLAAELCTTPSSVAVVEALEVETSFTKGEEGKASLGYKNYGVESLHGFISLDTELEEFAADVESLLGNGLENECNIGMEELGLIDRKEENCNSWENSEKVKVKEEEKVDQMEIGREREPLELCFDYDIDDDRDESPMTNEEVEEKVDLDFTKDVMNGGELKENEQEKRNALLQLDYEGVITAWASQKSPWVNGDKPNFESDQCWPHCMLHHQPYGELGGLFGGHAAMAEGGREARLLRYREKRQTRLFSKKIRYEVRKLNAEKRPRMKGRFVKRASFAPPPTFPLL
ncbi:PREDICTED: zinc finger protein CONSTANS-LIKE 16-like isoform X2 [Lupinus angustifolius]|uniref:zinc finger protein CONSTANS-LIKE 16-like isoform X2 n=1 Tax=Lupinus angustifolius TaxID=3871 RepID=UPI00092EA2A1|nr:PREDICTED: zinc finger protein CONSTANS-LIKE 16-like isoform X2 [Lupinus angustifolius]